MLDYIILKLFLVFNKEIDKDVTDDQSVVVAGSRWVDMYYLSYLVQMLALKDLWIYYLLFTLELMRFNCKPNLKMLYKI